MTTERGETTGMSVAGGENLAPVAGVRAEAINTSETYDLFAGVDDRRRALMLTVVNHPGSWTLELIHVVFNTPFVDLAKAWMAIPLFCKRPVSAPLMPLRMY